MARRPSMAQRVQRNELGFGDRHFAALANGIPALEKSSSARSSSTGEFMHATRAWAARYHAILCRNLSSIWMALATTGIAASNACCTKAATVLARPN